MSTLDAALALAAKGGPVFPIDVGTKKPSITGWPDRATTDPAAIRKWWAKWPDANVGLHTAGLLVLDVDGPDGYANLQRLRATHPLPDTARIDSGNTVEPHHFQLFYRLPPGLRGLNKPLDKFPGFAGYGKIDVKSTRGMVVGPGSRHATGGIYHWAVEPASLPRDAALAPDWAVAALCVPDATEGQERPAPGADEELFEVLVNRFPITGGRRHDQTGRAVAWLVGKGLTQHRVIRMARQWLEYFAHAYRDSPAEAERDLFSSVERTFRRLASGDFLLMTDHQDRTSRLPLPDAAEAWFRRLVYGSVRDQRPPQSTVRGLCSVRPRLSDGEARFVRCLLLHCHYEFLTKGHSQEVLLTDRQILAIHENVFGDRPCWDTFYRQKAKFVTRRKEDATPVPAAKTELMVVERAGVHGRPSIYRLTGLAAAFACVIWPPEEGGATASHRVLGKRGESDADQPTARFLDGRRVHDGAGDAGTAGGTRRAVPRAARRRGAAGDGPARPVPAGRDPDHAVHRPPVPAEHAGRAAPGQPTGVDRRGRADRLPAHPGPQASGDENTVPGRAELRPGGVGRGDHAGGGADSGAQVEEELIRRLGAVLDD
ncbi:MAG: bifunctional DNA primase/polymerase [Gemmataceae bacterium]